MGKVNVRFFANLKDLAGTDSLDFEIKDNMTVKEFVSKLLNELPSLKAMMEQRRVFISINQEMAQNDDIIKDGDEIGLLPPFSGG